jgi:hypothetical protein
MLAAPAEEDVDSAAVPAVLALLKAAPAVLVLPKAAPAVLALPKAALADPVLPKADLVVEVLVHLRSRQSFSAAMARSTT